MGIALACRANSRRARSREDREDLTRVIADTNTLITTMQSLFDKAGASAFKPAALKPVRAVGPTN